MDTSDLIVYQKNNNKIIVKKISEKKGREKKYFDSDTAIKECEKGNPAFLITLLSITRNKIENFYEENQKGINESISKCLVGQNGTVENFLMIMNSDIDLSIKNEILKHLFLEDKSFLGKAFGTGKSLNEISLSDIINSAKITVNNDEIKINGKSLGYNKKQLIKLLKRESLTTISINELFNDKKSLVYNSSCNVDIRFSLINSINLLIIASLEEKCNKYLKDNIDNIENDTNEMEEKFKKKTKPELKRSKKELVEQGNEIKKEIASTEENKRSKQDRMTKIKNSIRQINNQLRETKLFIGLKKIFVKEVKEEKPMKYSEVFGKYQEQISLELFKLNKDFISYICNKGSFDEIQQETTEIINAYDKSEYFYKEAIEHFIKDIKNKREKCEKDELDKEINNTLSYINNTLSYINNNLKTDDMKKEAAKQFTEYYIEKQDTKNLTNFISKLEDDISKKTASKIAISSISKNQKDKSKTMAEFINGLDSKSKEFAISTSINCIIKNSGNEAVTKLDEFINNLDEESKKTAIDCIENKIEKYEERIKGLKQAKDSYEKSINSRDKEKEQINKEVQKIESKENKLNILKSFQNINESSKYTTTPSNGEKSMDKHQPGI